MKEQAEIEVPDVEVTTKGDEITVEIERLAGMYDTTSMNSSFKASVPDFVDNRQSYKDNETKFVLKNVGNDIFTPKTLEELNTATQSKTKQEGLTINLEERPIISRLGRLVRKLQRSRQPKLPHPQTPKCCRRKFDELRRRIHRRYCYRFATGSGARKTKLGTRCLAVTVGCDG